MLDKKEIFEYIKNQYNIVPEYLWDNTPDVPVFRHNDTKKWFGIIMHVNGEEYFNVKTEPDYSDLLRNTYDYIIPAYHMNKEHWNTLIISRNVDKSLIYELIDRSFGLTRNNKRKNIKK